MVSSDSVTAALLKNVRPFPEVAARLLNLLSAEHVNIFEIAQVVSSDAVLTARLLQCVNSAAYGFSFPVTDIRNAIEFMGLVRTRQLIVTYATASYAAQQPHNPELQSCWQHSLATAVLADEIAKACGASTSTVFTAGILHDVGRLCLIAAYPEKYTKAVQKAKVRYLDLLDFEREEFGIDHAEAGRLLVEQWKLPAEFLAVTGRHHDRDEGSELDLLCIIRAACGAASALGFHFIAPEGESDVRTILDGLPAGAGKRVRGNAEELRAHVEQHIRTIL